MMYYKLGCSRLFVSGDSIRDQWALRNIEVHFSDGYATHKTNKEVIDVGLKAVKKRLFVGVATMVRGMYILSDMIVRFEGDELPRLLVDSPYSFSAYFKVQGTAGRFYVHVFNNGQIFAVGGDECNLTENWNSKDSKEFVQNMYALKRFLKAR